MVLNDFTKLKKILYELENLSKSTDPDEKLANFRQVGATHPELLADARALLRHLKDDFSSETSLILLLRDFIRFGFGFSHLPDRIGHYEILDLIDEGGMGIVYLGYQKEPVTRKVAIKVLKREGSAQMLRFQLEAKILARIDHPNVARIYEMGETNRKMPFIAMAYFPGERITDFCQRKSLQINQRISLFLQVCEGIAHIHRKGILHRDLKPSNILVQEHDHKVSAKIIDFGIAREITAPIGEATLDSGPGTILGTLSYMSPEQTKGAAIDLDVRSDVYGATAVLYEMLTGFPPLDPQKLNSSSIDQILQMIREEPPILPSKRVLLGESETSGNKNQLSKSLNGELDWVLSKGLNKDPQLRYGHIGSLAKDLERFLQGKPVSAGPVSALYHVRKFVFRHLLAVLAVSFFLSALFAATIISTRSWMQAQKARDKALLESKKSQATLNFFTQVLAEPNPYVHDKDIKLVDALDEISRQSSHAYQDFPEIRRDIHRTLGETYQGLGQYEKSARQYQIALDASRTVVEADAAQTLMLQYKLAELLFFERRFDLAESELNTLKASIEPLPAGHRLHGLTRKLNAHLLRENGRYEDAKAIYEALLNQAPPRNNDDLDALRGLGITLRKMGHLRQALDCYQKVLSLQKDFGKPRGHHERLHTLNNIANIYSSLGEMEEAEGCLREILKVRSETLGDAHPSTMISLHNLGYHLMNAGKLEESKALLEKSCGLFEKVKGAFHRYTFTARNNLGRVLIKSEQFADAEHFYAAWYPLAADHLGSNDNLTLKMGHNLSIAFMEQEKWKKAQSLLQDILLKRESRFGGPNIDTILTRFVLGRVFLGEGRPDKAAYHFRLAWENTAHALPNRPELAGLYQSFLGFALIEDGKEKEGTVHLRAGYRQLPEGPSSERERVEAILKETGLSIEQE